MALITGHAAFKDATITDTIKKITKEVASAVQGQEDRQGRGLAAHRLHPVGQPAAHGPGEAAADIEKEIRAADALAKSVAARRGRAARSPPCRAPCPPGRSPRPGWNRA